MSDFTTFCDRTASLKSMLDERERINTCAHQARSFFRMTRPMDFDALHINRSFEDHRCVVRPPPTALTGPSSAYNSGFSGAFAGPGAFDVPTRQLGLESFVRKWGAPNAQTGCRTGTSW
jgi:hypothetical protein